MHDIYYLKPLVCHNLIQGDTFTYTDMTAHFSENSAEFDEATSSGGV